MKKALLVGLSVLGAGCTATLPPPGLEVTQRLRPREHADIIRAASEQETWFRNAAFSEILNEPAGSVAARLADAVGLTFTGYQAPTEKPAVVNAAVGPVDDASLYLVVSSVVEMSTPSAEQPAIALLPRGGCLEMHALGPAVYSEYGPPVLAYQPPVPR